MLNTRLCTSFLGRGFYEMPMGLLASTYGGFHSSNEPHYTKDYYNTPVIMQKMDGRGLLSGLSKFFSWIKPMATKAWTTVKNIIPKIGDIIPQIGKFGEKAFEAIKKKDTSKIGELVSEGQKIGQQVLETGKDGYKSIKDILEHNRKMKEVGDKARTLDIAKQTYEDQQTRAREAVKAQGDIIASKVEASDPDKTVITDVTGKGLISRLLKKNSKLLRGRGFKLIH